MEHITSIIDKEIKKKENPIKTGFKFLDDIIGGFYPGELTVVTGCQNSGKTAFVITQLNNISVDQHILIVSRRYLTSHIQNTII